MTLLHDSPDPGYLRRLCRVYREKRSPVRVMEYRQVDRIGASGMMPTTRRMPRWAAFQIARHQASQARHRA